MTEKNKIIFLITLISALSLLYAGSFIFSPERKGKKAASYYWLEEELSDKITRIVIRSQDQDIELIKNNENWTAKRDGVEYPAKKFRVEDFIGIFSKEGEWTLKSSSASSHSGFGLLEPFADRITFYSGSSVVLDVLMGYENAFGNEVAMRKITENEVRSGDARIRTYISNSAAGWLNFRIFQNDQASISIDSVQRFTVLDEGEKQIFTRDNRTWIITFGANNNEHKPDPIKVDNYLRTILNLEGDDFVISFSEDLEVVYSGGITLEFDNGNTVTVSLSEPDETGSRFAKITGNDLIYSIPGWAANMLFRDAASFD